jgi:calcium-independent phospholipase A2
VKELLKNGADVNGACMQATAAAAATGVFKDTPERRGSTRLRSPAGRMPTSSTSSSDSSPENNNTGFDKVMIDSLNAKDMKNGGNPLHWVKSPQCMEPLIEMGCNINAKNFSGETVLHVMVQRRQMSCVVTLLSYGAEVNEKGPNGVTPLHLAVR